MPGRTKKPESASVQDASMEGAPPSAQPAATQDAEMDDVEEEEEEDEDEELDPQRVKILPGSTDSAASFEFLEEGHTMGNALRYIIMKNPDVEFCAYAIPHPSEPKMNIRIQTYRGTAIDALKKGLTDLQQICDVVTDEFSAKREAFNAEQGLVR